MHLYDPNADERHQMCCMNVITSDRAAPFPFPSTCFRRPRKVCVGYHVVSSATSPLPDLYMCHVFFVPHVSLTQLRALMQVGRRGMSSAPRSWPIANNEVSMALQYWAIDGMRASVFRLHLCLAARGRCLTPTRCIRYEHPRKRCSEKGVRKRCKESKRKRQSSMGP